MGQPRYDREVVHTHVWVHQATSWNIDDPTQLRYTEVCTMCWKHRLIENGKIVR